MLKEEIINYLHDISRALTLSGEIEFEDLKNLLLICFYILIEEETSILIKSYLITILKEIIEIENNLKQNNNSENKNFDLKEHLAELLHYRILPIAKGETSK